MFRRSISCAVDMARQRKHEKRSALKTTSQRQTELTTSKTAEKGTDHTSKLPDDILVGILSLLQYKEAVQTASVSRRWERLVARLPNLSFSMSLLGYKTSTGQPSETRVQSMRRTLQRRCRHRDADTDAVQTLQLLYRKDVPMECRHADEFMAFANARRLLLHVQCARGLPDEDAGAWSLELPPATTELHLQPYWYAVRPPRIHGASVATLRSLTLWGLTVLRQDFLLTELPSLEDLAITMCTLDASIEITSDSMPRLKRLDVTEVTVAARHVKAAISVLAAELTTLRLSGRGCSDMESPSLDPGLFLLPACFRASFTIYSSFRLHAPKLQVFDWQCAYADEVHVESVGRLSDVTVEIAAGRMPKTYEEERTFFSVERRDSLMTDILQGLMPGLRPRSWEYVKRKCVQRGDMWLCFEIRSAVPVTE